MSETGCASIYVGNLDTSITELTLRRVFSPAGSIRSVKCPCDKASGKCMGYGFVNFATSAGARTALDIMQNVQINGRAARVMLSERDSSARWSDSANLFVQNLQPDLVDEACLYSCFKAHGEVLSVKIARDQNGHSRGFGFVQYKTEDCAEQARKQLNKTCFVGQRLSVTKFRPSKVCRVKNSVVDSETKRSRDCSAQRLGIHVGKSEGSDGISQAMSCIDINKPALWAEVDPKLVTRTSSAVCHTPQGLSILPLDHCNMRLWHTLLPVTQPIYILPALYYPSMHFFIW